MAFRILSNIQILRSVNKSVRSFDNFHTNRLNTRNFSNIPKLFKNSTNSLSFQKTSEWNPISTTRQIRNELFGSSFARNFRMNPFFRSKAQQKAKPIPENTEQHKQNSDHHYQQNAHQNTQENTGGYQEQQSFEQKPILVEVVQGSLWKRLAWSIISPLIFVSIFVGFSYYFLMRSDDKKTPLGFPITNAHQEMTNVEVKFDDVKGLDEVKDELKEVIEYLKNPQKFKRLGARLPKGVLLFGPPGTGKTLLARAVAGEAGVRFLYCSGSSFDEMFVGVGPKRIRNLFDDAVKSPNGCIIFIDELDTLGMSRQISVNTSSRESTLNQLLTELDGFKQTEGVIVMGATNFPEALDSALIRPGRFDKQIVIRLPDIVGRKEIIDYYLSKTKAAPDVDSTILARGTPGFSGADLSNLVNLAAIKATLKDQEQIDMIDLEEAKDDVMMGIKKKGGFKDPEELRVTAYHEGGHALVALLSENTLPVHKATIIPRGHALGLVLQLPEKDEYLTTKKQIMAAMAVCYGGRVAEELVCGPDGISAGATSDLQKATGYATQMVAKYGMFSEVGPVSYDKVEKLSESERQLIDQTVKNVLQQAYEQAKDILTKHRQELDWVAEALLEHETLTGDEIKAVIRGEKIPKKI